MKTFSLNFTYILGSDVVSMKTTAEKHKGTFKQYYDEKVFLTYIYCVVIFLF